MLATHLRILQLGRRRSDELSLQRVRVERVVGIRIEILDLDVHGVE